MSLESIAVGLTRDYPLVRYGPYATLHSYALYWDEEKGNVTNDPKVFGRNAYASSFRELVAEARTDKAWKNPTIRFPNLAMYEKQSLLSEAVTNMALLRRMFITKIASSDLRETVEDILYDLPLIIESSDVFVDTLDLEKVQREPDKNYFEECLHHYDLDAKALKKTVKRGFIPLVTRLKQEGQWDVVYMDRLRAKDSFRAKRLDGIFDDIAQGNIQQQERLRFIEALMEKGCLGLVDMFGPESYDLLVALYGEKTFPEAARAHVSSGRIIRQYLGKCRKTRRPPEFDPWKNDFVRALQQRGMKPSLYERDIAVQRLMQGKFVEGYLTRFCAGEDIFPELMQQEEDLVKQKLKEYALHHFRAMQRVGQHPAISKSLPSVRIRKGL